VQGKYIFLHYNCLIVYYLKLNYKIIFSDPYVRIELNTIVGNVAIDSVLTKTKKKVNIYLILFILYLLTIKSNCVLNKYKC